jgi:hypothetical protein
MNINDLTFGIGSQVMSSVKTYEAKKAEDEESNLLVKKGLTIIFGGATVIALLGVAYAYSKNKSMLAYGAFSFVIGAVASTALAAKMVNKGAL